MSLHSHYTLIKRYLQTPEHERLALAMVVNKEGSSYRKPGAMMLVSELGQNFGLVSGGCLESDIVRRARQVFHSGQTQYAVYDMLDEGSYAADLGIGCNGKIGILIQELTPAHRDFFQTLLNHLENGEFCQLIQLISPDTQDTELLSAVLIDENNTEIARIGKTAPPDAAISDIGNSGFRVVQDNEQSWSCIPLRAPFNVWVFGGGADAQPLVRMATELGWRITLVDHRTAYARAAVFAAAETIIREHPDTFTHHTDLQKADAAVLMTHNLTMDASWLQQLSQTKLSYVALLGPPERRDRVLDMAGLADQAWTSEVLHGPAGFDLGGELPESIALSILAECHAHLHKHNDQAKNARANIAAINDNRNAC